MTNDKPINNLHKTEHSVNCNFYWPSPVCPMRPCHGSSIQIWICPYSPSVSFYLSILVWQCVPVESDIVAEFVRGFFDMFAQWIRSEEEKQIKIQLKNVLELTYLWIFQQSRRPEWIIDGHSNILWPTKITQFLLR